MRLNETPLFSAEQIRNRVNALGVEISNAYQGRDLILVAVLKGAIVFAADLMRALDIDVTLNFIRAKSYVGTESRGTVSFSLLPETLLEDRHILLLDDILDTGRTCSEILAWINKHRPASVRLCTLLNKPGRRISPVEADFTGFTIENHYVVGYGLDFEERYRHLPAIHILEN